MEFTVLDFGAIILGSVLSFVVGSLWYGPLFGKAWMKGAGIKFDELSKGNLGIIMTGAFALTVFTASFLWAFIGPDFGLVEGGLAGAAAAIGFVAAFQGINYLYEGKSFTFFLINAGYALVTLSIIGLAIGAENQFFS